MSKIKDNLKNEDPEFSKDYFDRWEWGDDIPALSDTCDWCGGSPVVYRDEAFELCENCANQLLGE